MKFNIHKRLEIWEYILVLNTRKEIGNAALSAAIAYFGSNGYVVSIPLNDTQDYDLVVDNGDGLQKVQVKGSNTKRTKNSYTVGLRTISGTTRKVCKTVNKTDIDLLFCLCGDGSMYLIPHDKIKNETAINLSCRKSKYSKKSSTDYSQYRVEL